MIEAVWHRRGLIMSLPLSSNLPVRILRGPALNNN
jgi:hypothetical protein